MEPLTVAELKSILETFGPEDGGLPVVLVMKGEGWSYARRVSREYLIDKVRGQTVDKYSCCALTDD